jgi:hypothetical protein
MSRDVYIPSLSPESIELCFELAGLLAWPFGSPSHSALRNSGVEIRTYTGFTATGIAPDSHRFPFSSRQGREPDRQRN